MSSINNDLEWCLYQCGQEIDELICLLEYKIGLKSKDNINFGFRLDVDLCKSPIFNDISLIDNVRVITRKLSAFKVFVQFDDVYMYNSIVYILKRIDNISPVVSEIEFYENEDASWKKIYASQRSLLGVIYVIFEVKGKGGYVNDEINWAKLLVDSLDLQKAAFDIYDKLKKTGRSE